MRTFPKRDFFMPDAVAHAAWERRVHDAALTARDALHLTHGACLDGAASDVVLRASGAGRVATLWIEPHETLDALDLVLGVPGRGRRLVVTDLSLQKGQEERLLGLLSALAAVEWRVEWRDHHARQWDDAPIDEYRSVSVAFRVDLDGKECGATMLAQDLGLFPGKEPWLDRFLTAVRDHDLWLRQDRLAVPLNDAARALGSDAFVARVLETRDAEDPALMEAAAKAAEERKRVAAEGVAAARVVVGAEGASVGVVYGDAPVNDVLHVLYTDKGADVGVLLKPEGTFSLRSRKGMEVCHTVAQEFGGGGHPNAAGGTLDLKGPSLAAYWLLRDRHPRAKALVRAALREAAKVRASGDA